MIWNDCERIKINRKILKYDADKSSIVVCWIVKSNVNSYSDIDEFFVQLQMIVTGPRLSSAQFNQYKVAVISRC